MVVWQDAIVSTSTDITNLYGVAYGNSTFVAVGNKIMTSNDGMTWGIFPVPDPLIQPVSVTPIWKCIIFANGHFIAISINNVMRSSNGIDWTVINNAPDYNWISIAYLNGKFVAVSDTSTTANRIMTSPDGITWTLANSPAIGEGWWYGVAMIKTTSYKFQDKQIA
jgi:hypothetical protein